MPASVWDVSVMGRIGYDLFAVEHNRPLPEVEHFSRHLGGSSANISVGLARLGLKAGIISCVGEDLLADYLLGFLRQEGVDTRHVRLAKGYNTSLCLTEVSPPDRFPQVFYRQRPADTQITIDESALEDVRKSKMFVTNGTNLSASPAREATFKALEAARGAGVRTVFDMDYRESSWNSSKEAGEQARKILPWVDVVLANDEELYILTGKREAVAQVNMVTAVGVSVLVRKLGAKGAEVCTKSESFVIRPCRAPTLCTIGAGDGFAAGFLYGLHRQMGLEDCLKYGNAAAAVVVSRVSCSDAMPRLQEIEDCIHQGDNFELSGHK
jgi:5-dehydro-2-deoxygluconokinase